MGMPMGWLPCRDALNACYTYFISNSTFSDPIPAEIITIVQKKKKEEKGKTAITQDKANQYAKRRGSKGNSRIQGFDSFHS